MLKRVRVDQLRLGMHIHELCGAWLDHPFWKTRFVLRDPADLQRLRDSGIGECWIDIGLGLDVAPVAGDGEVPVSEAAVAVAPAVVSPPPGARADSDHRVPAPNCSIDEELKRAAALCLRSREAVRSLFGEARMGRAVDAARCLELVDQVASSVWRNPAAMLSLARLKTHDDYSYMHSVAVCALMVALARQLGMDEAQSREAGMAGLLHDMGKAVMPLAILNKPGKLTEPEFDVMRSHPQRGYELLQGDAGVSEWSLDVCLHHHERIDGSGYPHRLHGDQISRIAKMGAVCDVYDAITSNRPYKAGWDPAESIARMAGWTQGHFDAGVFKAFVTSLGIYPTGSLVRLQSGLLAVVVEQNPSTLVSPIVKAFYSTRSRMPVPTRLIDLAASGCRDRILARESNAQWQFSHLDELWAGPEALRQLGRGT